MAMGPVDLKPLLDTINNLIASMAANQAQPEAANPINATPVTAEDILRKQSLHFDPFKPDEESF